MKLLQIWPCIIFLCLMGYANPGLAQTDTLHSRSLLWKVSKPGNEKPAYLFGTIHVICANDYLWTGAMNNALLSTDEVCLEMDMDEPSFMMEVAMGMMDKSGKSLQDYFDATQYARLSAFMKDSIRMDISLFQKLKPSALFALLAANTAPCPSPIAYETTLTEEAHKQNKEVTGLETVTEQLGLFDTQPVDSVVHGIMEMTKGYAEERAQYNDLLALYKDQNLPALYAYILRSKQNGIELDDFLDARNEKWIGRMTARMDKKSVFFAVGAGHLWGDKGLITLLKKEGYNVVPVR